MEAKVSRKNDFAVDLALSRLAHTSSGRSRASAMNLLELSTSAGKSVCSNRSRAAGSLRPEARAALVRTPLLPSAVFRLWRLCALPRGFMLLEPFFSEDVACSTPWDLSSSRSTANFSPVSLLVAWCSSSDPGAYCAGAFFRSPAQPRAAFAALTLGLFACHCE